MEISGTFLPFQDNPNGNGRIYSKDSVDASVLSDYIEKINNGTALGEPFVNRDPDGAFQEISLSHISHKIINLELTDKGLTGKIEILETPSGNMIKGLLEASVGLVVRPRCGGVVDSSGNVKVDEIYSFDILTANNDTFNPYAYRNKRIKLADLKKNKKKNI